MARIDSAFDVEEWDPDLPSGYSNNSPELLSVKPSPVTYTTVGSLVKSNAIPHFTPPIRMQREGTSRRPLVAQSRGPETFFGVRGTPAPQSGIGYGSPHAKQIQNYNSQHGYAVRSFNDAETLQQLGIETAMVRGSEIPELQLDIKATLYNCNPFVNDSDKGSEPLSVTNGNQKRQSMSMQSSLFVLDKMQTIQRLAQFPNPQQQ
jgi:hypothetical protein